MMLPVASGMRLTIRTFAQVTGENPLEFAPMAALKSPGAHVFDEQPHGNEIHVSCTVLEADGDERCHWGKD